MINSDVLNDWLPLMISVLALFFSIFGFWWTHWRTGRLIVSSPRSFMAAETNEKIIVELPLSFYNEGAAAIVIDNLLLRARQQNISRLFRFEYTRDELGGETHHWATQLALAGREAVMKVFSFQVTKGETNLSAGTWDCALFAKLNNELGYREVSRFKLNVSRLTSSFSAIDNTSAEYQAMMKRYTPAKR